MGAPATGPWRMQDALDAPTWEFAVISDMTG